MKYFLVLFVSFSLVSCQKNYVCVCNSIVSTQDTIVDHIKTTRLGSKGYQKTCKNKENARLANCRLQ